MLTHPSPVATATDQLPQVTHARNPGMPLDLDWVAAVQANTPAIERRAATLAGRRSVKKDWQAAWLLKAITMIDLTTLSGDDTEGRVQRLCAKARQPVRADLLEALGMPGITTGANDGNLPATKSGENPPLCSSAGSQFRAYIYLRRLE